MEVQSLHGEEGGGVVRDPAGAAMAWMWRGNAAVEAIPAAGDLPLVCWSGWTGDGRPGEGWFERTASAWLPAAAAERERVVGGLVEAGAIIRPHARHLVSDIPACLNLLRKHEGVRLLLEPAALLEPSMMETAGDHIERMLTALGGSAWGVLLSDAAVRRDGDESWCVLVAAGEGVLDMEHLRAVAAECAGPGTILCH